MCYLWPFVFVMTDVINEYFGRRGVRFITYLAIILIVYAFIFAFVAIRIEPADWWVTDYRQPGHTRTCRRPSPASSARGCG